MDPQITANNSSRTVIGAISVDSNVKESIAKLLKVPSHVFDVMDSNDDIYIIHYKTAYADEYDYLRGVIVDLNGDSIDIISPESERVLSRNSDLPEFTTNHIDASKDGSFMLDCNGKLYEFKEYQLRPGYEGITLRVFKVRGNVYFATYKSLFALNKKWGNLSTFGEMWEMLMGPAVEDIFDVNEATSPLCYHFLLVHKDLQIGSRFTELNPGFVVLTEKEKRSICKESGKVYTPQNKSFPGRNVPNPDIFETPYFTIEEANDYLKYGLHEKRNPRDERLENGEMVILKCLDTNRIVKIVPPSYAYRKSFRTDVSIENSFFIFIDYLKQNSLNETQEFCDAMVPINFSMRNLPVVSVQEYTNVVWPMKDDDIINYAGRAFIHSLPPVLQKDYKDLVSSYFHMRQVVASWIIGLSNTDMTPRDFFNIHKRVDDIITQSRKFHSGGVNPSRGRYSKISPTNSIRHLVYREYGTSLVKLYKIAKYQEPPSPQDQVSYPSLNAQTSMNGRKETSTPEEPLSDCKESLDNPFDPTSTPVLAPIKILKRTTYAKVIRQKI
jgi:hypothetical protein